MAVIDKRGVTRLTLYIPVNLVSALKLACVKCDITPSRWVEQRLMQDQRLWNLAHKPQFRIKLNGGKKDAGHSERPKAKKPRRAHGREVQPLA